MSKTQKIIFGIIIFLAVFFRYYQINQMPGGLFPDEAANGLDINLMQQGHLQPFYERGNGREALFFYMEWASSAVFGIGPWQFHIVSALVGVLSVLLCFLLTRRLFSLGLDRTDRSYKNSPDYKRATNIALLAAFFMAVNSWHVVLSRTAFRANLIPLFTTLTFYLLLVAYQAANTKRKLLFAFLTGAAFALGFYTYIAYRIMAPILVMIIAWPLLAQIKQHKFWKTIWRYKSLVVSFLIAFAIFIYPIGHYFYTHPGSFIGRSGQVSIFNQTLYTLNGQELQFKPTIVQVVNVLGEVTKESLLGFFTRGDLNWRHNISGYPFLSALISPFFGIGLIVITLLGIWYFFTPNLKAKHWKYYLLTGWFWGMLLPVVTTAESIPHGLRSIGLIPAVFIISAWAIYEFARLVMRLHNHIYIKWCGHDSFQYRLTTGALKSLVVIFGLALILQTYFMYFVYAYNSPENFYYFRSDLTVVSDYLNKFGHKNNTYLVLDKFSLQTTDFLTEVDAPHPENPRNNPYIQVDPEDSWKLANLKTGDQIVFTQSSIFDIKKFKKYHPEASLAMETRNKFGQAVLAVYKIY